MPDPTPSPTPAPACHHPEPRANGPRGVGGADVPAGDLTEAELASMLADAEHFDEWPQRETTPVCYTHLAGHVRALVAECRRLRTQGGDADA